jgi:hypothetical protein
LAETLTTANISFTPGRISDVSSFLVLFALDDLEEFGQLALHTGWAFMLKLIQNSLLCSEFHIHLGEMALMYRNSDVLSKMLDDMVADGAFTDDKSIRKRIIEICLSEI